MKKQTVMWTALPNGVRQDTDGIKLKLSAIASIRLWTDEGGAKPTLGLFPDFLNWPAKEISFQLEILNFARLPATRVSAAPRSDLWQALFNDQTYVKPYGDNGGQSKSLFDKYANLPILSYPTKNVQSFLRGQYVNLATTAGTDFPSTQTLLAPSALGAITTLGAPGFSPGIVEGELNARLQQSFAKNGAVTPGPAEPKWDFFLLKQFHQPLTSQRGGPVQVPTLDFHQILSLLGEYPVLLRMLGLVHDLEVTFPREPAIPPGEQKVQVIASWSHTDDPTTTTTNVPGNDLTAPGQRLLTRCTISADQFVALPHDGGSDLAGDGTLKFDDANTYDVVQIDPDGGALKLMDLANNLVRAKFLKPSDDTPQAYSVPSLRSAGLSVTKADRAVGLHLSFQRQSQRNQTLESGQPQDMVLDREDITRGFAIDVWDSASQAWHSLCERVGNYNFGKLPPDPALQQVTDEGWVSIGLTTSADGSANYAKLHESVTRWWGWSLSAPRPGKTVAADGSPDQPANAPPAEFNLQTSFRPKPGSLPRLRFGVNYRLRARAVDLAGNRVPVADPAMAGFGHATPETPYGRFDPVTPPVVVLRHPRTEGESLERVVIRSNFDKDVEVAGERHLVPPKTDEVMAESHSLFDGPNGVPDKARYSLLTRPADPAGQWEGGSIADLGTPDPGNLDQPYVDVDTLKIPYLPDLFSRGAILRGLPSAPPSFVVPFDGQWPEVQGYRLVLKEGSAAPALVKDQRLLVVYLPKAEVATVRLSSFLALDDADKLGLLFWMQQAGVDGLTIDAFRKQVNQGAHWMVTPYRTLTLVHAVRQPLLEPKFQEVFAQKILGDTFATIQDRLMTTHRKSTITVDINAEWTEFLDPLDEPKDKQIPVKARAFQQQITLPKGEEKEDVIILSGRHEFHDTKYRKVNYTAIDTSRFGEYFVTRKNGVTLASGTPFTLDGQGVVEGSESVRAADGSVTYVRDQDYTMDYPNGTITPLANLAGTPVNVAYLVPPITRETPAPTVLDVLNSARPAAPKVLYVLPTFSWTSSGQPNGTDFKSQRKDGGLRVYLDRPWWSSGEGELLGVVLSGGGSPIPDNLKPYVTQWGADPVFRSAAVPNVPTLPAFKLATVLDDGVNSQLSLDEMPGVPVQVAGHQVAYDEERRLWYCDLDIDIGNSYFPFVRLALVRFQPKSVKDAHLSRVVLADYAQLAPGRTVSVVRNTATNPPTLNVTVSGFSYQQVNGSGGPSRVEVSFESRRTDVDSATAGDLAWSALPNGTTTALTPTLARLGTLWQGTLQQPVSKNDLRLVIKEFELYPNVFSAPQRRLVFADTVQITGPTIM